MGKFSAPLAALIERITYHTAPGKILSRWKWEPLPTKEATGMNALPCLRLELPTLTEAYRPRAYADGSLSVDLLIAVRRSDGVPGLVAAIELVMDAIDTNAADELDLSLDGTVERPVQMDMNSPFATDLSLNGALTVNMKPRPAIRGSRRT